MRPFIPREETKSWCDWEVKRDYTAVQHQRSGVNYVFLACIAWKGNAHIQGAQAGLAHLDLGRLPELLVVIEKPRLH